VTEQRYDSSTEENQFPRVTGQPCELCQLFPIVVEGRCVALRMKRLLAKEVVPERRKKLRRVLKWLRPAKTVEIQLHSKRKDDVAIAQMLSTVPGVTRANWKLVRDQLLYGPQTRLTRGPGSFLFFVAERFVSRRTMARSVVPLLSDLRLEYDRATEDGRHFKALWLCARGLLEFDESSTCLGYPTEFVNLTSACLSVLPLVEAQSFHFETKSDPWFQIRKKHHSIDRFRRPSTALGVPTIMTLTLDRYIKGRGVRQ